MINIWLSSVVFSGGVDVALQPGNVVTVIGPNNTGKSVTLKALKCLILGEDCPRSSVESIKIERASTLEEITTYLRPARVSEDTYTAIDHGFPESAIESWWSGLDHIGPVLGALAVSELTTRNRLIDCDPQEAVDPRHPFRLRHPFHHMYRDPDLEQAVSSIFRRAFKADLVVHRSAGSLIPAYMGERPSILPGEDRISLSYLDRIERLEPLEKQGDGIRSFASIVGRILTENRKILLIDEPEAFLHPPQARLVAEVISSSSEDRQTFVATHSSDVLRGLMSRPDRVSVIRLSRQQEQIRARYLDNASIEQLWRDPILRFGNILDGLFHDGVIVAEADADCRFYESLVNAAVAPEDRPDIHYTYSGGKDRLPVVIRSLTAVGVPVATIVDFDVLRAEQPLRKIVEAHGGNWTNFSTDWAGVTQAVEQRDAFLSGRKFREEVTALVKSYGQAETVPQKVLSDIKKIAKRASPWDNVKDAGLQLVPAGKATIQANRLLAELKRIGIFVAPNGEMEGFCRTIDAHGPRWVEAVLRKDLADDQELGAARDFVKEAVDFIRGAST